MLYNLYGYLNSFFDSKIHRPLCKIKTQGPLFLNNDTCVEI